MANDSEQQRIHCYVETADFMSSISGVLLSVVSRTHEVWLVFASPGRVRTTKYRAVVSLH